MDPVIIASSFSLLFLAEMGDKSQLIAMTLACRFRLAPVVAGVLAAFLLLNLLAIAVGTALFEWLPQRPLLLGAGALFLFFAYRSWRDADGAEDIDGAAETLTRGALVTSFAMIFVAELGDKTQLAMIGLAAGSGAPWSVFTGGTLALWAVSLIGILVGASLLRRIAPHWLHRGAAVLFLVFGLLAVGQALLGGEVLLAAAAP
jgi:putative Ca2+/H+ antiporter (TMEM165/GDT1 family)